VRFRVDYVLDPDIGLLSVVDFYTAGKESSLHEKGEVAFFYCYMLVSHDFTAIGGEQKKCGWFSRWFWQIWFDFDHVDLSSGRRSKFISNDTVARG
jgi:betaine lipid synthase